MADRILTQRDINRATLARQMLLERASIPVPAAIERLVGLQAQLPVSPYVALWTRLPDFKRSDLADLIEAHRVVKATMMRATLHILTAEDYLKLRATLQPALIAASANIAKRRGGYNFDRDELLKAARDFIAEKPRTFAEISDMVAELMPEIDVGSLRYTVRTHLPLVQVPITTGWSYPGNPQFTLADSWIGKSISPEEDLRTLVFRYLAAFGPATVADIQTWSGLPKLKDAVEKFKPDLQILRDEKKRELLDLPDMPLLDGDTPAPERFLPEFDNLLLSHQNRTRVIADEYRKKVYLPGLRVAATILVDGFVRGVWKVETKKGVATLTIEPFAALTKQNRAALTEEGEQLVRFVAPDAKSFEVGFAE
jgi:hypothetical protein